MVLSTKTYDELFIEDFISNGKIAQQLNSSELCHKTVCPECFIDDFTHIEGCSKLELIAHI